MEKVNKMIMADAIATALRSKKEILVWKHISMALLMVTIAVCIWKKEH